METAPGVPSSTPEGVSPPQEPQRKPRARRKVDTGA